MSESTDEPVLETMWTVDQIAAAFQVSGETVRNWLNDNKLKGIKIGGQWRVPNSDLVEFTKARYQ